LKWFVIARKQKINVPFWEANRINIISSFYGSITPSKIGSIIRAEYLKKYTNNIGKGVSNFVLDKVLDLGSLFFLAIFFSLFLKDIIGPSVMIYSTILLFAVFILTLVFYNKERARFLLGFVYRRALPDKTKKMAKGTFNSFYEDIPKKRFMLVAFLLNLVNWMTIYFATYLIGLSVGINLPFFYFLAFLPIGTIVAQIPISINGLGTREAVLISLFALFNISATKVFSMSILSLFFTMIIPSLLAIYLIYTSRKRYKKDL